MSAPNSRTLNSYSMPNGRNPETGAEAYAYPLDFTLKASYDVDLAQAKLMDQIEMVQAIYLDNSLNSAPVICTCGITGQVVTWPAGAQGYMTVMVTGSPKFTFSTTTATLILTPYFLNFPVANEIWFVGTANAGSPITFAGSTGVDRSANAIAQPPAANLLLTIAVNAGRNFVEIQNQSIDQIYVVRDDGLGTVASITNIVLAPASATPGQGSNWTSNTFKGRLRVYSGNAASKVGAYED